MTTPPRRPLTFELLADLHAGALDEDAAAQLWAQVHDDPHARSMLATLDATVADLAAAAPLRMPADVATRLDVALAGELAQQKMSQQRTPRRHVGPADLDSRRRRRWLAGGVAAAAAAVVGMVALAGGFGTDEDPDVAGPGEPLALTVRTIAAGLDQALDAEDFGPLTAPTRRLGCLQANGVTAEPIGARQVTVDGTPGVLLVFTTGEAGRFRLLVVGAGCGPGAPALVADRVVGP